ncbi:MAG: hypothetical protein IJW03_03540 [Clostridia bacterium]|nr:hypothetical protein [Clostridia bacterium]
MNISGSGHIGAGEYNESISVSGSGKLDGNVRCIGLHCSGSVRGAGSVDCSEDISVSGSCHIEKCASAKSVKASGSMRVGGDLTAGEEIKASGSLDCGGSLKCAMLKCSGSTEVGGEIEADEVHISGKIVCTGLLNAEKIDISFGKTFGPSKIGSIGGSEIKIHNESSRGANHSSRMPLFSRLVGSSGRGLTVGELIEGDTVAIECVSAPRVVGRVVAIGAGCEIDLVQYSDKIEIHPDAKIGNVEKI